MKSALLSAAILIVSGCGHSSDVTHGPSCGPERPRAIIKLEKNQFAECLYRSPAGFADEDTVQLSEVHEDLPHIIAHIKKTPYQYIKNESGLNGYFKIIYYHNRPWAADELAEMLGVKIVEEDREVGAIVLKVNDRNSLLQVDAKLAKGDFEARWSKECIDYEFNCFSMRELAEFIDRKYNVIVIDETGLPGYWKFTLPEKSISPPRSNNSPVIMGNTGLYSVFETRKIRLSTIR